MFFGGVSQSIVEAWIKNWKCGKWRFIQNLKQNQLFCFAVDFKLGSQ